MVYYFTSNVVDPPAFIYVGKDKVENEDLIKFGWDEDVCAHVYLRLKPGQSWTDIQPKLLEDCNKKDNVTVIYTPWSNLRKDASMATGQVSFHDPKAVKKVHVPTRQNPIVNRLNKTKVEKFPDLRAEREADQREKRKAERIERENQKAKDREERKRRDELRWQKDHAYDDLMREENMVSNEDRNASFYEDDFM
ncbi:hypothetical protein DV738_g2375, partial [Chaetothyriales sp. CBS 135597]